MAALKCEMGITPTSEAARARETLQSLSLTGKVILQKVDQFLSEVQTLQVLAREAYKNEDFEATFRYLDMAYKIDNGPEIMTDLALLYEQGKGVGTDVDKAIELLTEAERKGSIRAKSRLGRMFLEGIGVPLDQAHAVTLLLEAAEQGDDEAMGFLALAYLGGQGVAQDKARGVALMIKAAEAGNVEAQSTLSLIYTQGGFGIDPNKEEAIKWARRAAQGGDAASIDFLDQVAKDIAARFTKL